MYVPNLSLNQLSDPNHLQLTNMASDDRTESPAVSSFGDPFEILDVALADMTKELLPVHHDQIRNSGRPELETMITELAADAIQQFKDKDLTKMMGKCVS